MVAQALTTLRRNRFSGQRSQERGPWKQEHAGEIPDRRELM